MEDWKAELAESFWEIERSNKMLRTKKGRDGDLWFEVSAGRWVQGISRGNAEATAEYHADKGGKLSSVEDLYGPLTDVTDTGEPLDTEPLADWEHELLESAGDTGFRDTPRKPEPGDRVRVSYEAEYLELWEDGRHNLVVCSGPARGNNVIPSNAEVTVIEPARPAVPEDPKRDLEEVWHNQNGGEESEIHEYNRHTGLYVGAGGSNTWEHLWEWTQEVGHKLYPLVVERGAVIGG